MYRFEKLLTLKIQFNELKEIKATSADNINMSVDSTVNWRIVDPQLAATMAAQTMLASGASVHADITKITADVVFQALASLAAFIGAVNYSESFHMSAAAAHGRGVQAAANHSSVSSSAPALVLAEPEPETATGSGKVQVVEGGIDNPLYDMTKMGTAVDHANKITRTYGVEILSINIIMAKPIDDELTSALALGAVASAAALQRETAARGEANAMTIQVRSCARRFQPAVPF